MNKVLKCFLVMSFISGFTFAGPEPASGWTSLPLKEDPLVRMPGTQPGGIILDVSNPLLVNLGFQGTASGDGTTVLPSCRRMPPGFSTV